MSANPQLSAHFLADKAIRDPVYQFAEDAWAATDADQLDSIMVQYLRSFGIRHYAFYVGADTNKRPAVRKISGSSHAGWRQHYDANQLGNVDVLLKSGFTSDEPTTWLRFREQRKLDRTDERIYHEANDFGLSDGFFMPLHQADGSMLGVTMLSPVTLPTDRGSLAILHMLSLYYTMAARRVGLLKASGIETPPVPDLTPRQIECLQWIAAGKSSWEIELGNRRDHQPVGAHRERAPCRRSPQAGRADDDASGHPCGGARVDQGLIPQGSGVGNACGCMHH